MKKPIWLIAFILLAALCSVAYAIYLCFMLIGAINKLEDEAQPDEPEEEEEETNFKITHDGINTEEKKVAEGAQG